MPEPGNSATMSTPIGGYRAKADDSRLVTGMTISRRTRRERRPAGQPMPVLSIQGCATDKIGSYAAFAA